MRLSEDQGEQIVANIELTKTLIQSGDVPHLLGTVCGSQGAGSFWERELAHIKGLLKIPHHLSLVEDLPVNQAFGLLLMWQRLRPHLPPGHTALMAFVFGEGSRSAPWTEAELGQKPAILSFAPRDTHGRRPSVVALALRSFLPVEAFLRRSGFDGVVVKWGDEIQIPARDLSKHEARFETADIVRFVSMQTIDADSAANKDWVGVSPSGRVTAFIPRRPLPDMEPLADRGVFQRTPQGALLGGVNLGSIALSRPLLDRLLEAFSPEVNDPTAARKQRPDLDPQLFTALCIAALPSPAEREEAWTQALEESAAMRSLEQNLSGVLPRLRTVLDGFEADQGRPINIQALDFEGQYWGDIGQHPKIYDFYSALRSRSPEGRIARALAELPEDFDEQGNLVVRSRVGSADVKNSVLVDAVIEAGTVHASVLLGTEAKRVTAQGGLDVESTVETLTLSERAGSYRVLCEGSVSLDAGVRQTSVPLPEGLRVLEVGEHINLRDRANNYETSIGSNPISFAQANAEVRAADPTELETIRTNERARLRRLLFERS